MIHAIPFKVVHPCPRPPYRPALPPLPPVPVYTLYRRRSRRFSRARHPPSSSPSFHPSLSLSHTPMRAHTYRASNTRTEYHTYTHSYICTRSLSLSLSYYPPTGSLFLRVTTQWRCHTLAPSSNQCYCFIVPLLLLLLDTRKGDPSIPESVRERRGRVASTRLALPHRVSLASLRLASPRLASPCFASPRLASPRLALPRLASPRLASPCRASSRVAPKREPS